MGILTDRSDPTTPRLTNVNATRIFASLNIQTGVTNSVTVGHNILTIALLDDVMFLSMM